MDTNTCTDTAPQLTASPNRFKPNPKTCTQAFAATLPRAHTRPKPSACNRRPCGLEARQTPTLHLFPNVHQRRSNTELYLDTHAPRPGSAASCVYGTHMTNCQDQTHRSGQALTLCSQKMQLDSGQTESVKLSQANRHCAVDPAAATQQFRNVINSTPHPTPGAPADTQTHQKSQPSCGRKAVHRGTKGVTPPPTPPTRLETLNWPENPRPLPPAT